MRKIILLIACVWLAACGSVSEMENIAATDQPSLEKPVTETALVIDAPGPTPVIVDVIQAPQGLIESLASDFSWNRHLDRPKVQKQIASYQKKPEQLEKMLSRSADFLPLITEQLNQRGLPTELAFLPLVESGYLTSTHSPAGAAGLWQLMPATARHLGMEINWWYDERLDIQASTQKALDYLEYLNKQFKGDWELTITAYNGGEGHVRSRMRRANSKNFWELSLKIETEGYLPRLLAVTEIISAPEKYGLTIPQIEAESRLQKVKFDQQIDLRLAAQAAGLEYQLFKVLNPDFQRWVSPPDGNYALLLPEENANKLRTNLNSLQPDQLASWDHYKVKSGDTLIDIAREFGTTVRALIAVNELKNSRIYARQELLIPKVQNVAKPQKSDTVKELYIVKNGDSLWKIANRNNISISQLKKLNSLTSSSVIQPGQVLILNEYFTGKETTYQVKQGDSLSIIAYQFDVAIADLKIWNALGKNDLIHPGQILKIRKI